ncbi:Por secretion system C-terminal sorting domain-containing protein [Dyadobacter soli]|uniref:Por secretion system C-terminal sorting domain-containing protein n=1 Tax=Dyadobacter soli TaxID=659014 RepID=A0A1G7U005_9BACT|nr:T9SS type A sorting domain-containing protein [Dyadobacter soli]SDG40748.1 Por secretion system C-terminal sorting domain-containing protein [Dyadobacter soli]
MRFNGLPLSTTHLRLLTIAFFVALLLGSPPRLLAQRELILNTTGYGFDRTAPNGIHVEQWQYILKFANLKHNGKDASPTAIRLHIQWEHYEPALGDYQRAKMAQAVKAILDLNPNMKVALHFSYLRPGYWNDSFLSSVDVAQLSNGSLMREAISNTTPSVFSEYATGRFLAFVDDALAQVQQYSSRILYVAMGNNGSEEFYMPNKVMNSVNYAGMFEAKALQAWRTRFLPIRFPGQTNATWGRNSYPIASAPQPTDGNYNSEMGRDLHRFAAWGLLTLFKDFYETVKNRNSSIKVLHFISDVGSVQGNNWHLHSSTLPLALELSDGIYHTDGTSQWDLWKKIMGIDVIKGTYPNKIAGLEFDPTDLGQPSGGQGLNGGIPYEWLPRAYKHGADYVHIAMHFSDIEIAQLAPTLALCREQYLKPSYQPPARAEAVTVNIFPNVFTGNFLFETWNQIGGQNFGQSDLQPKSIRMTDTGYWENIWESGNYLPCSFSVNVNTAPAKVVTGAAVTLSINCQGPECNAANYVWSGEGATNQTGSSITINAPDTPGNYNYTAKSTRSGCSAKSSSKVLQVARALPVKLIDFTAVKEGRQALLAWSTSEEVNSEKFDVERSTDGKKWVQIGSLPAGGDVLNAITRYNFTDSDPSAGENLYRLKMIDRDRTFAYSKIVNVNFKTISVASTYPNPASDRLTIEAGEWENVKTVTIINTAGQVVYSSDEPRKEIDIQGLPSGSYVIGLVRGDGAQENVKFVKDAGK